MKEGETKRRKVICPLKKFQQGPHAGLEAWQSVKALSVSEK